MARFSLVSIVVLALLTEGVLYGLYAAWAYWRAELLHPTFELRHLVLGLLATIPLCLLNGGLLYFIRRTSAESKTREFIDQIIKPLADELNVVAALFVSLAAGFCEELLFRRALFSECGFIVSSVLFSLMHFGPAVTTFRFLAVWYTGLGAYLALVLLVTDSIWPAVVAHACYDFIALLFMRYCYPRAEEKPLSPQVAQL